MGIDLHEARQWFEREKGGSVGWSLDERGRERGGGRGGGAASACMGWGTRIGYDLSRSVSVAFLA